MLRLIVSQLQYQFINIHQRTKTVYAFLNPHVTYQFINIHQRTKTLFAAG